MNQEKCPRTSIIDRYLNGDLSSPEADELERHLDDCLPCGETLRGLAQSENDTLDQLLKQNSSNEKRSTSAQRLDEEPLVARLIEQMQAKEPTEMARSLPMNEDRAAEVLWLLQPDEANQTLGTVAHYRLTELLGSGSTGVVFAAWDTRLNREVALKVLRPTLGPSARQRFLKEARAAAGFQHDNILTLFEVGESNGLAYITMQLHPGETLDQRLERVGFLPETDVRNIAAEIGQALVAAHGRGIIHRDLKPANIWLVAGRDQIKLLDFGLARVADADPQLTASGILAGTPNFMSPEQARGLEVDGRSDLFSLGCLLYRCITGRLPFNSTGILATLQAIQYENPPAPATLKPACSQELSALVMALLEKQPDRRPANAEAVLHALDHPRSQWRFATPEPELFPKQPPASPLPIPVVTGRHHLILRWAIVTGILGILAFGAWLFGSDIVRIVTNQGEIVVESSDNQIKIEVLQNGSLVRIVDLATSDKIDLQAGQYTIQPGSGGGEYSVSPETVTLSRGGRQVVKVSRSPADPANGKDLIDWQTTSSTNDLKRLSSDQPQPLNQFEPTYNRRTFDELLRIVRTERNLTLVSDAIVGLGELSRGDTDRRKIAIDEVTKLIGIHGGYPTGMTIGSDQYHNAFIGFKRTLSVDELIELIRSELKYGNPRRREFVYWLYMIDPQSDEMIRNQELQSKLKKNSLKFLETWLSAMEKAAQDGDEEGMASLAFVGRMTRYWHGSPFSGINPSQTEGLKISPQSPILRRIRQALSEQTTWQVRAALLDCLATVHTLEESDWISLVARLVDQDSSFEERWSIVSLFESHTLPVSNQFVMGLIEYGRQLATQPIEISYDARKIVADGPPELLWNSWGHRFQMTIPDAEDLQAGILSLAVPASPSIVLFANSTSQSTTLWYSLTWDADNFTMLRTADSLRPYSWGLGLLLTEKQLNTMYTTTDVGELVRVIRLLGRFKGSLADETRTLAIQWLEEQFQPVDESAIIELLQIEDPVAREAANNKVDPNLLLQFLLHEIAAEVKEKLPETGQGESLFP